jgi:hypothetical protein
VAIFAVRRMDVRFEQRVNIKFCVKLGNDATFVNSIIAEDESWCFQYDPQTKRKSAEWRSTGTPPAATMELTGIPKEAFTTCFQDLQKRWQQCIDCGGNYFEGDRKHYL